MAHWAAAMAVLATEAALMRLPSLEAMSLGRMSKTGSEMGGSKLGEQFGKGHRWGPDLLEPLANSTLMVLPSMVSGGCRACRICSSCAASLGEERRQGQKGQARGGPRLHCPISRLGAAVVEGLGSGSLLPALGAGTLAARPPPVPPSPRWWRAG